MRYKLLLLFLFGALNLKAQSLVIDIHQISLINPDSKFAGVLIGTSSEECVRVLGKPDEISDYYSEIDDDTMKLYRYGKSKLFFLKDKLSIWDVLDDRIWVGQVNGTIFKIGDKLAFGSARPSEFRGLAINHYASESRNMSFAFASTNEVKDGNSYLDSYFELLFDSNGLLFSICKGDK
ncbi:hypothetical protein FEM33_15455 [Dyadobacter flavalbus]|uniref:WG repeat-containing protein n=1 Tax=Dyadobacter flavalbus TaxID=2579942 RepID=A0A5M8QRI7_9BACT|nr:hypothetical protein [Dyadobacter flavalbus]KAA6438815.1 hypothetical protein FEM33_15455 [Dyadobacter flavalbus]